MVHEVQIFGHKSIDVDGVGPLYELANVTKPIDAP